LEQVIVTIVILKFVKTRYKIKRGLFG
jgi:hypothetical protein